MAGLFTPAKQVLSDSNSRFADSPFSDYFTDEARSKRSDDDMEYSNNQNDENQRPESPSEARHLLARLARIQLKLKHSNGVDSRTLRILEQKLSEFDRELVAENPQTRIPPEMEDSGLFMDDGEDHKHLSIPLDDEEDHVSAEQRRAESDFLLLEAQRGLSAVAKAQERLKQCHEELRGMRAAYDTLLDEHEAKTNDMRIENDALRSASNANYEDLNSLQAYFDAVEKGIGEFGLENGGADSDSLGFPDCRGPAAGPNRGRVMQQMDAWRSAWVDVCDRMRERRRIEDSLPQIHFEGRPHSVPSTTTTQSDDVNEDVNEDGEIHSSRGEEETQLITADAARSETSDIRRTTAEIQGLTDMIYGYSLNVQKPKVAYSSKATQTESQLKVQWADVKQIDFAYPTTSRNDTPKKDSVQSKQATADHHIEDDCAVTSSSEAGDDNDSSEDDPSPETSTSAVREAEAQPTKQTTAWQDLWTGLTEFMGMNDDRFDTLAEYATRD